MFAHGMCTGCHKQTAMCMCATTHKAAAGVDMLYMQWHDMGEVQVPVHMIFPVAAADAVDSNVAYCDTTSPPSLTNQQRVGQLVVKQTETTFGAAAACENHIP